jgi:hypothetical protein
LPGTLYDWPDYESGQLGERVVGRVSGEKRPPYPVSHHPNGFVEAEGKNGYAQDYGKIAPVALYLDAVRTVVTYRVVFADAI